MKWVKIWRKFRLWRISTRKVRRRIRWGVTGVFLIWYACCLPEIPFSDSTSTVLLDRDGILLGARIADDGQWRFPETHHVPYKVATCLVEFEDRHFYSHIGISAKGTVRAIIQNSRSKRVVSGGSTITMQLVRIMRKNPPRTYSEKLYEMVLATRMEIRYSKKELLALYASHAPFGNNVVGLDAASWRYFGRSAEQLSWAESATLAVLPNAPGLIYPGKNHESLLRKRNRLLKQLLDHGYLDQMAYNLALSEPLPEKPLPLPHYAPHLLEQFIREGEKGNIIRSTIRLSVQEKVLRQLENHHRILKDNRIMNGAVLVTDVGTGEILAYVGNTETIGGDHARDVNCVVAARSTGSILKPLLYMQAMQEGQITPEMLIPDIPSQFGSFSPKNYSDQFDGVVPASKALSRSLNIPMVHLLNRYGTGKFKNDLEHFGLTTFPRSGSYYGLSLILGGGEANLYELNRTYTQLAQDVRFGGHDSICTKLAEEPAPIAGNTLSDRGCIYATFEALLEVNRPDEDNNWKIFSSSRKIAWKTGTSFGFRDAWAIGVTPDYVVSVWIGNADGEGRPGLTGVKAAAPVLLDVFRQLPINKSWFRCPDKAMKSVEICRQSGHPANEHCPDKWKKRIPKTCLPVVNCPYHQLIHLDRTGTFRVDSDCESVYLMQHRTAFVLPPAIERYYKNNHPGYVPLPDFREDCKSRISDGSMHLVYPKQDSRIYVPVGLDGNPGKTIFEAGHRSNESIIYWHLDDYYLGETRDIHQLEIYPAIGDHRLTLIDQNGVSVSVTFQVIGSSD